MSLIYKTINYLFGKQQSDSLPEFVVQEPIIEENKSEALINFFYNADSNNYELLAETAAKECLSQTVKIIAHIRKKNIKCELSRRLLIWLQKNHQEALIENLPLFMQSRHDDFAYLPRNSKTMYAYLNYISEQLVIDRASMDCGNAVSFIAKWIPSETSAINKRTGFTFRLAHTMQISMGELRKNYLSPLRIYIEDTKKTVFPDGLKTHYEIISPYLIGHPLDSRLEAKWVPTRLNETAVICDVSLSTTGIPLLISVALGLLAQIVLTFEPFPQIVEVVGETLYEKVRKMRTIPSGSNTNICEAIRQTSGHGIRKLIIVSDMPLSKADDLYNEETQCLLMEKYSLPEIVYWNVKPREIMFEQKSGITVVSGFSPEIFQCILDGKLPTAHNIMITAIIPVKN